MARIARIVGPGYLCQHEQTGRPLGSDLLIDEFEVLLENNSGRKRPDRKVHGKKGEMNNLVSCPRNFMVKSLGVTPIIIGLTVVVFGTSAPELKEHICQVKWLQKVRF